MSDEKLISLLVKKGLFSSKKDAIDTLVAYALKELIQEEFFRKKIEFMEYLRSSRK